MSPAIFGVPASTTLQPIRERDVERHLVRRCKELGFVVRKLRWLGRDGAPDRVVFVPPIFGHRGARTVWVELKAPGASPRARQVREHAAMRAAGQWVVVADTIEKVDALLALCERASEE